MRDLYKRELIEVEGEFMRERKSILDKNANEINALFEKQRVKEEEYIEKRADLEAEQAKQLEDLRSQEANDQQEQKIKLETEMQILEKCMEDMKAVYKLNEAKLEFNLQVLNEREKVNTTTKQSLVKRD